MTAQSGPVILFSHSVLLALILPKIFVALCVLRVRRSWDPRRSTGLIFFARRCDFFSLDLYSPVLAADILILRQV